MAWHVEDAQKLRCVHLWHMHGPCAPVQECDGARHLVVIIGTLARPHHGLGCLKSNCAQPLSRDCVSRLISRHSADSSGMWRSLDFHAMQFGAVRCLRRYLSMDGCAQRTRRHWYPLVPVAECWTGTDLIQKAHIELVITIALFDEKPS